MKILVNIKNYTPYKYDEYYDGGTPENNPFVVGQVVVIKEDYHLTENGDTLSYKYALGVVLGVLTTNEVRTDMFGMVSLEDIRPANVKDFFDTNIFCCEKLQKECEGFEVNFDWKTYELSIK
jgi:hypothetical protein